MRGFSGNAVRTERGIQYLGKRLAKYVLLLTYPDQPYFPLKGPKPTPFSRPFGTRRDRAQPGSTSDSTGSTLESLQADKTDDHAYQITSISFIGHSLGGLVQTYAIAYIQKHSPRFFDQIKPVNFIALATPFLGLSNENPIYVRFALDLGLVGRTGQDLGLSWTAPKVRSGWGAMIAGRGDTRKDQNDSDPGSKPLLRILPCGPAHEVLSKFQHRTVYSNVVNDGIVPLRTSCLLFLDWRGLGRVDKARRDNGLVGTMAEWGWAELTGANSKSPRFARSDEDPPLSLSPAGVVPPKASSPGIASSPDGDKANTMPPSPNLGQFLVQHHPPHLTMPEAASENAPLGPLDSFLSIFRLKEKKSSNPKQSRIYNRSQTLGSLSIDVDHPPAIPHGQSHEHEGMHTPPKTTFFESAGDLLMPPLPPANFILDPAARPRTIFHDRVYHPGDIPPPSPVKRRTLNFGSLPSKASDTLSTSPTQRAPSNGTNANSSESGLKVEEKIARAYHRDLSWRKVLVRLEPDAHNNIIVRRMFTNAYGWPVVKHLIDTHFGHTPLVGVEDAMKQNVDRAKSPGVGPTSSGEEVEGQSESDPIRPQIVRGDTDILSSVSGLFISEDSPVAGEISASAHDEARRSLSVSERGHHPEVSRQDSARWTDREIDEDDDCESGLEDGNAGFRWSRPT